MNRRRTMSDNEQMNKKVETVADILEEMRGMGNYQRYSGDHAHALSDPPRQCDVGTAEEQAERMRLYCNSHGEDESGCFRCDKCPFLTVERCELAWAQMPYEAQEGGAK